MTHQGNLITVPAGLDPKDTKAIVSVLVDDALNRSGQNLWAGWCGSTFHPTRHT